MSTAFRDYRVSRVAIILQGITSGLEGNALLAALLLVPIAAYGGYRTGRNLFGVKEFWRSPQFWMCCVIVFVGWMALIAACARLTDSIYYSYTGIYYRDDKDLYKYVFYGWIFEFWTPLLTSLAVGLFFSKAMGDAFWPHLLMVAPVAFGISLLLIRLLAPVLFTWVIKRG
jgi:hypothetical protein